ncbi:MAG TPA: putative solute-binding protein [Moraxellaceae bacterium]
MKLAVARQALGRIFACLCVLSPMAIATQAHAAEQQVFCVWDILGEQGDAANMMKDYALAARGWGANLKLKVYTNEGVAADDFKAGQCDGILMTGLRGRQFNQFTGSIDSVGAIPSYTHMRDVIDLLANPKLAPRLISGPYEVVGVVPVGAAYAFVNDRSINTLAKAAGKKIAVLDWDKSQAEMVKIVGAVPVSADLTTYGGKFNNGQVDILFAPIPMYKPMELYKGLGTKGGIARFPVIQITLQLLVKRDKFPADFGQKSRVYVADQVPRFFGLIRNTEREVDPKHWMHVPLSDRDGYEKIMREMRIHLTKSGYYDQRMMTLLKRIRCKREPDAAECALNDE